MILAVTNCILLICALRSILSCGLDVALQSACLPGFMFVSYSLVELHFPMDYCLSVFLNDSLNVLHECGITLSNCH